MNGCFSNNNNNKKNYSQFISSQKQNKKTYDSNTNSQTSFSLAACVRHEATQPVKFLAAPRSVVTDVVATCPTGHGLLTELFH